MKKLLCIFSISLIAASCNKITTTRNSNYNPENTTKVSNNTNYIKSHYTSQNFGISFDYAYKYNDVIKVYEKANRIILSTSNIDPYSYVNIYTKNKNETLTDALERQFGLKKFPNCKIVLSDTEPNRAFLTGRPIQKDSTILDFNDCPKDDFGDYVGSSNYIGYFSQDPISKTKYIFVNAGQDPLLGDVPTQELQGEYAYTVTKWYQTIKFEQ